MLFAIGNDVFDAHFIVVIVVKPVLVPFHADHAQVGVERVTARICQGAGIVKILLCRLGVASLPAIEHLAFLPVNDDFLSGGHSSSLLVAREFVTYGTKMIFRLETVVVPVEDQILDLDFERVGVENRLLLKVEMPGGIRLIENERGEIFLLCLWLGHVLRFFCVLFCLFCLFARHTPISQLLVQQNGSQE